MAVLEKLNSYGGIDTAVRLLRAMDVQAFDTAVTVARREANNAMTAARAGGKVLQASPFFVRGQRVCERQADYEFWKTTQERAWRDERMRQATAGLDEDVPGECDGFWSD